MFYSPLRYPGGKNRLAKFIEQICIDNNITEQYVEPYAGGSAVALYLLLQKKIHNIIINDYDRAIYAFWWCVLNKTNILCKMIENTPVNVNTWKIQKSIQIRKNTANLLELGFSTFFLNRTNISGIINAGPIGGISQNGKYKINCRFNKVELIKRIQHIAQYKNQIKLYNLDALDMIKTVKQNTTNHQHTLFYFDPPYFLHGSSLYMNHYTYAQHKEVSEMIKTMKNSNWIISYDNHEKIIDLYNWISEKRIIFLNLNHFAYRPKVGKEVVFLSENITFKRTASIISR